MTKKYFGTDGIRGEVGVPPIVPDFMLRLGYAAGQVLARHARTNERQKVLIGKDTRISGYLLEAALESDFQRRVWMSPYAAPCQHRGLPTSPKHYAYQLE